jgi:hypothetical protein
LPGRSPSKVPTQVRREAVFHDAGYTVVSGGVLVLALLPKVVAPHPRDPQAIILRPLRPSRGYAGTWAGKFGAHRAHHGFERFGRLPHLQLNLWRIGVKGSGRAFRMPLLGPRRALDVMFSVFG